MPLLLCLHNVSILFPLLCPQNSPVKYTLPYPTLQMRDLGKEVTCLGSLAESREVRTRAQVSGADEAPTLISQAKFSASTPWKREEGAIRCAGPSSALCLPSTWSLSLPVGIFHRGLGLSTCVKDVFWKVASSYQLVFAKEVNVKFLEGGIKNKIERSP